MGGDSIENIKKILDSIFVAIDLDDDSLEDCIAKLKKFSFETLSSQELYYVLHAIEEIQKRLEEKKCKILQAMEEKEHLKNFQF